VLGAAAMTRTLTDRRLRSRPCIVGALLVLAAAMAMMMNSPSAALASGWSSRASFETNASPTSISCPTSSFCMAVDTAGRAVAENAGTWGSPITLSSYSLTSISCATSSFCVAVDEGGEAIKYSSGSWGSPLSIDGLDPDGLSSISCPTSTFCVAVDDEGEAIPYTGGSWGSPVDADPYGFTSIS
jgi:hypothetical protein